MALIVNTLTLKTVVFQRRVSCNYLLETGWEEMPLNESTSKCWWRKEQETVLEEAKGNHFAVLAKKA